jgi:hypothetical protein
MRNLQIGRLEFMIMIACGKNLHILESRWAYKEVWKESRVPWHEPIMRWGNDESVPIDLVPKGVVVILQCASFIYFIKNLYTTFIHHQHMRLGHMRFVSVDEFVNAP